MNNSSIYDSGGWRRWVEESESESTGDKMTGGTYKAPGGQELYGDGREVHPVSLTPSKMTLEEAQAEWDRRKTLKVELEKEFKVELDHDDQGLWMVEGYLLPPTKEREAILCHKEFEETMSRMMRSVPDRKYTAGYNINR